MRAITATLDGTAQKVGNFNGLGNNIVRSVTIQNAVANATVSIGDKAFQPLNLLAGQTITLPVKDLNGLYISGTNTQTVAILAFG